MSLRKERSIFNLLLASFSAVTSFSSFSHHRTWTTYQEVLHNKSAVALQMSPKNDDQSYNDDAFGLIFLSGGLLAKNADFSGTFLALSAVAATCTTVGVIKADERIPAAVAIMTLFISPIESSLRLTGSLESVSPPSLVEIGLCSVSAAWAFLKWSRQETTQQ
ncbi:hypothetical protein ACHAWC_001577 [Mediolabrus comicus]